MPLGVPQTPTPPVTAAGPNRQFGTGLEAGTVRSGGGAGILGGIVRQAVGTVTGKWGPVPTSMSISEQIARGAATGGSSNYAPTPNIPIGSPSPRGAYDAAAAAQGIAPTAYTPTIIAGQYDPRRQEIERGLNTGWNGQQFQQRDAQAANDAYLRQLAAQGQAMQAAYAAQVEALRNQGDINQQRYNYNVGSLRADINAKGGLLANARERDVNINRDENQQRWQLAQELFARQGDLLQKDWAYNLEQRGRAGSARDLATSYFDAVFGNQVDMADFNKRASLDANRSQSAVKGSYASVGNGRNISDIGTKRDMTVDAAGDARTYNTGQANQQYDATIAGLQNSWNQRDAEYQNQIAAAKAAAGQYDRTNRYLDTIAADYGIKGTQLQQALNDGLANLGFDAASARETINAALASKDAEKIAAVTNLVQQAVSVAGPTSSGFASYGSAGPVNWDKSPMRPYNAGGGTRVM